MTIYFKVQFALSSKRAEVMSTLLPLVPTDVATFRAQSSLIQGNWSTVRCRTYMLNMLSAAATRSRYAFTTH